MRFILTNAGVVIRRDRESWDAARMVPWTSPAHAASFARSGLTVQDAPTATRVYGSVERDVDRLNGDFIRLVQEVPVAV